MNINPELLLACAEMAYPEEKGNWRIAANGDVYTTDWQYFRPLKSNADAMKLGEALERNGFKFWFSTEYEYEPSDDGRYRVTVGESEYYYGLGFDFPNPVKDKTSALRYVKCVSAQTSIPLLANNTEGV